MSNKTQLQTNNTNLASYTDRVNALIDMANSLPEAGGSGGGAVETCTVTFLETEGQEIRVYYMTYENDSIQEKVYNESSTDRNYFSINVLKNSFLLVNAALRQFAPMDTPSLVVGDGATLKLCHETTTEFNFLYVIDVESSCDIEVVMG